MAVNCVRQLQVLNRKLVSKSNQPVPNRVPRVLVPPEVLKDFTTLAVMEYMQRIAEQISESTRRTIQLEAEQQQRIQAMWKDLYTIDHHFDLKTHMIKSASWLWRCGLYDWCRFWGFCR